MATVAVTVGVAVGTGHVMQYGLSFGGAPERAGRIASDPVPQPAVVAAEAVARKIYLPDALPTPPAAALMPVSMPRIVVGRAVIPPDDFRSPDIARHENLNAFGIPCETRLTGTPVADAMVRLDLVATCRPNQRVEISHGDLRFAMMTSAVGDLRVDVPALETSAGFLATFADGETADARTVVLQSAEYDRVALQWSGSGAMSIHAFEFGAGLDDPGHVYTGKPASHVVRTDHVGGSIVTLGDPAIPLPALAEVYSFPRGEVTESGVVRLHVEAEVTPFTCGKEVEAEAIQASPDNARSVSIRLAMPECDAVGDILVLKNILRDLKIASN